MRPDRRFWAGQRVLLTGHTGFKGAWLALMLEALGAEVTGVALAPPDLSLFGLLRLRLDSHLADIADAGPIIRAARPTVVLHLAAQALVPEGFANPAGTFATNLGGTVTVLQALRGLASVRAALIVTTDKVYRNDNTGRRFVETDPLGGADPYSASKAACELAVASWRSSFADLPPVATARAGNVIGGGDFAPTRLVPDLVRAIGGAPLVLRHPQATRPWQHVLDVLIGYLLHVEALAAGTGPPALNFGPDAEELAVTALIEAFETAFATPLPWRHAPAPAEAARLALDPSLAASALGWRAGIEAVPATAAWYAAWRRGEDMDARSRRDVAEALG